MMSRPLQDGERLDRRLLSAWPGMASASPTPCTTLLDLHLHFVGLEVRATADCFSTQDVARPLLRVAVDDRQLLFGHHGQLVLCAARSGLPACMPAKLSAVSLSTCAQADVAAALVAVETSVCA